MISGYPHDSGGFLELAGAALKLQSGRDVELSITHLDNFTAPRAARHLASRALRMDPDYVVIQLGSTDCATPLRRQRSRSASKALRSPSAASITRVHAAPPGLASMLRWQVATLASALVKPAPLTPLPHYVAAIETMVEACLAASTVPVVLSPFTFGNGYCRSVASAYAAAIGDLAAATPGMLFVDCLALLARFPASKVLVADGFHLSRFGHARVGELVAASIGARLRLGARGSVRAA